jgi:7 transmembrane helices usually fused to an inactive transglutaminase
VSRVASEARPTVARRELAGLLIALVAIPLVVIALKHAGAPLGPSVRRHDSLAALPVGLRGVVTDIVFVPLGALIVVTFRLTLGLRVLGPFRSILLALAFLSTGILLGLAFFAGTVAVLMLARPMIKSLRLPYFGRVSVMLSLVALLLVLVTLAGEWAGDGSLRNVARFPIVVLCLIGEAVARSIRRDGAGVGVWRASMTAVAAVGVTAVAEIPGLLGQLLRSPELMLLECAGIIVVSRFAAFRLLDRLNPSGSRRAGSRSDRSLVTSG